MGMFNSFGEDLHHLTPDGELPFGWMAYNKHVVNQIEAELSVLQKAIYEAKEPTQKLEAIKMYLQYLEDGKSRYAQIGECERKYFEEYVIDSEQTKGNIRKMKVIKKDIAFEKKLIRTVKKTPGILQKDLYKMFDPEMKGNIQEKLCAAENSGVIIREKSGNTYRLFVK